MLELHHRIAIGAAREARYAVLGVAPEIRPFAQSEVRTGRLLRWPMNAWPAKVAVVHAAFARTAYGSEIRGGAKLKLTACLRDHGTFRERVDTFGQSNRRE